MSTAALKLSQSAEWFTPLPILESVRAVLGEIELDPASCAAANERVKAKRYYTEADDGLSQPWKAETVFLNPPGDRSGQLVKRFWARLVRFWTEDKIASAIYIGFSLEQLVSLQAAAFSPMDFDICIPSRRVAYDRPDGTSGGQPPHGSFIAHLPSPNDLASRARFRREFLKYGAVRI